MRGIRSGLSERVVQAQVRALLPAVAVAFAVAGLIVPAGRASAQIYGGTDANGTLVLSDFASALAPHLVVEPPRAVDPATWTPEQAAEVPRRAQSWGGLIREVARAHDLPPQLLHAVVAVESGFDPLAISPKGAMGLMQLMPGTARRFNVVDPFDPRQNLTAGATYLKWLLGRFGGDTQLALAAYNAGENAVVRAGYRIPPYEETRAYVPRVLKRMALAAAD
jgi:soluble lytic murein transglycosylase-like protein